MHWGCSILGSLGLDLPSKGTGSTSFGIFVVTQRVTNVLPNVVDILLFYYFYEKKNEFPFFEIPIFNNCHWFFPSVQSKWTSPSPRPAHIPDKEPVPPIGTWQPPPHKKHGYGSKWLGLPSLSCWCSRLLKWLHLSLSGAEQISPIKTQSTESATKQ